MSDAAGRVQRRRRFCPEVLEGRNLLSAVGAGAMGQVHAEALGRRFMPIVAGPTTPITTITGTVSGTAASQGLYAGTPRGFLSFSGHGSARPLGGVLFGTAFLATPRADTAGTFDLSNGAAEFIDTRAGNQLRVLITSGTALVGSNGRGQVSLAGTVASGTGRFEGATGTFQATGSFNVGTLGRFTLHFTVTFSAPR